MIIVLRPGASEKQVQMISDRLVEVGYEVRPIFGVERTVIGAVGGQEHQKVDTIDQLRAYDFVDDVMIITKPYKFVAKEYKKSKSVIDVRGLKIGGDEVVMMAGPCTVESEDQLMTSAKAVAEAGATVLRGGAYKPSTSPYSFHGMGLPALELLAEAGRRYNLRVVTEVMDPRKVEEVSEYSDILQIGARNMQNYDLLREVGQSRKAVMLKRGLSAKYEEWLLAAEYIASGGNESIMLCERGIRSFETYTRNVLDVTAVPVIHNLSHLPVVVDPSHGCGRRDLVATMSNASVAAGADALIIEVHPNPDHAIKDGAQSITFDQFREMMPPLRKIAEAIGRSVAAIPSAV
ncbi:MAG: 3-deoxy-7-phosphoheptulonate synthase [Armatimonadetes bacterium]|nr:3-deoxy-7-phosphoheptulonate synthase [Armatimonadota bacterium]